MESTRGVFETGVTFQADSDNNNFHSLASSFLCSQNVDRNTSSTQFPSRSSFSPLQRVEMLIIQCACREGEIPMIRQAALVLSYQISWQLSLSLFVFLRFCMQQPNKRLSGALGLLIATLLGPLLATRIYPACQSCWNVTGYDVQSK